ncbi:MAG: hypothetical protein ACOYXT_11895 [Bacteroidota bacterium]
MNAFEEELQKNIEAGKPASADDLDIKAYQQVFKALQKEPTVRLSKGFEDRVLAAIAEKEKKSTSRDMLWLWLGVFSLVVTMIIAVAFTSFKPDLGFLKGVSSYKGLVVFGIFFIALLNWIDKRLVKNKQVSI